MKRKVDLIVVHCSDSNNPAHDNIETIRKWHVDENGWSDVGYHFFIDKRGGIHTGRPEDIAGAHTKGHNARSIGICLSGRNGFTDEQFRSLELICLELTQKYNIEKKDILGHKDFDKSKTCPNFDVTKLVSSWKWH